MDQIKSLDEYKLIAALYKDVLVRTFGSAYSTREMNLDLLKIKKRLTHEGVSFLTKALPRLGRAFDRALDGEHPLNLCGLGLKTRINSSIPKLFGMLFERVFSSDGRLLEDPCVQCIGGLRQLLFALSKYELPYSNEQEQQVIDQFIRTEQDLESIATSLSECYDGRTTNSSYRTRRIRNNTPNTVEEIARGARVALQRLFLHFDPSDIFPRHGPGVVATKQRLWSKYSWTNVSERITRSYPLDAYFYASQGHVCDRLDSLMSMSNRDLPAQVILVPKDSRGPRLISCEPVDFQWVQQGLGRAIVRLVESHPLTRYCVFFTDQGPNQIGALYGSSSGRYATLDLKDASDRITLELVRLLFPDWVFPFLENCRSSSTVLPDGMYVPLLKHAPMGSALCFPILALCVWAILYGGTTDTDTREGIHVYGDDVIVPTAYAEDAIKKLELFGLKVNRDKSFIRGHFRESCGVDAFKGNNVTPLRFRTVWSSNPSPDAYSSWMAYANNLWDRQYYHTYDYIVGLLHHVYGELPCEDMWPETDREVGKLATTCPTLRYVPQEYRVTRYRINHNLQKREWRVRVISTKSIQHVSDGWEMLLRFFAEGCTHTYGSAQRTQMSSFLDEEPLLDDKPREGFRVSSYTQRSRSMLRFSWR